MTSELEIKGEWFLPQQIHKRVHGTLKFVPTGGATLEIYGSFCEEPFFPELRTDTIILGVANDSTQVTLFKCFTVKSGGATSVIGDESGKPHVVYSVNFIFTGAHISTEQEMKFNSISSEIFNLDEWVSISGFNNKPPEAVDLKNGEISVSYKLPTSIVFQINSQALGRFRFFANRPGLSYFQKSINITQGVTFEVDVEEEKTFEEILSYVLHFQNFLVLALYQSTHPTSIILYSDRHQKDYGDGKVERRDITLYFSVSIRRIVQKPKFGPEMLFDYRRIKDEFPNIIKSWFEKNELLEPAFNLLFEQFYNGNRFTVNTFLNLAQSAETFHARIHNHTKIPREEFANMKKEILEVTPTKYHSWLKDQFNFGNNLNLHSRLTELSEKYSNSILDKLIPDKGLFVKQVKNSRNYYTHYSTEGKKNALKGKELFYLTERLKALLVCAFLMEVGFSRELITKLMDNVKWKYFNHLTNW